MKRIEYQLNELVGDNGIIYISEGTSRIEPSGRARRMAIFKCLCGEHFTASITDVKSNKVKSCGCSKFNKAVKYNEGDSINGVTFIRSLGIDDNLRQRALFKCPECSKEWNSLINNVKAGNAKSCCGKKRGWSKTQWINFSNVSYLYVVELFNEEESFIKVGITTKDLIQRFKQLPYEFKLLRLIQGESGYIFDLENRFKSIYSQFRYSPRLSFNGDTECFTKRN